MLLWVKILLSVQNTPSLLASSPGRSCGWAGKGKESLQLRLWNLNICIEKVDAKC